MERTRAMPRLPILAPVMLLLLLVAPAAQPRAGGRGGGTSDIEAADEYRFVVVADSRGDRNTTGQNWGVNDAALSAVFAAIGALDPQPRFVFFSGDLVWGVWFHAYDDLHRQFDAWRDVVGAHYPSSRIFPVFGGHERSFGPDARRGFGDYFDPKAQGNQLEGMACRYYHKKFNPPGDGTSFSRTAYYCDYGEDRFFVLNNDCIPPGHSVTGDTPDAFGCVSHELGCGQFNWLRSHLVGNGKRHNFFFQHEPAYGTGAHSAGGYDASCPRTIDHVMDGKKGPRSDYIRLLGFHNGTFIFSGHEHQYTWRSINYQFAHSGLNDPDRVKRSLALLLKADPVGQSVGPAVAYSYEGAVAAGRRSRAPILRLWWRSTGGEPDWQGSIRSERDDAEQFNRRGGGVDLDGTALELMREQPGGEKHRFVGLRWTNVPVLPEGASIQRAEIRFTAQQSSAAGPKVTITAEATPFAFPFSQCRRDLQRRPRSGAKVGWQIGAWQRGQTYDTPDLAPIIQELLDEHGYGGKFGGEIQEIKTGSCGAPWRALSCARFSNRIRAEVIQVADWPGSGIPYHYAVVDVRGDQLEVAVRSWDGTPLPVPQGWGGD